MIKIEKKTYAKDELCNELSEKINLVLKGVLDEFSDDTLFEVLDLEQYLEMIESLTGAITTPVSQNYVARESGFTFVSGGKVMRTITLMPKPISIIIRSKGGILPASSSAEYTEDRPLVLLTID